MKSESEPIDPMAVLRALGITAETATPLAGGWDTAIWRVERGGEPGVLRLLRSREAERCRREALAMEAARAAGVPASQILARGTWEGRPALFLSWLPGTPLVDELRADLSRASRLGDGFGRTLARLHAAPAPEEMKSLGSAWVAAAGPEEGPLQERLRELAVAPATLLHLDYHPMNVLAEGDSITGVVDWANAAVGDPRADVARTLVLIALAAYVFGGSRPAAERAARRQFRAAFLSGYRAAGGRTADMAPFLAWGWAATARDLAPNLERPGHWLRPEHLTLMHRRVAAWKRRAGL